VTIDVDEGRPDNIEADIAVFENVSLARARFFDGIVENRNKNAGIGARELRQDTVYQLAEFYYLLGVFEISGGDGLARLGKAHNRKIEELCDSPDLHDKLGIQPQRLEDAMFDTDDKIARLQANCGANGVRLSQSDLARFVIEYMSPETCRTVVKVLAEAGYLHLTNSPFGAVLVASNGRLEEIYGEHIRSLRRALESISRPAGRDAGE
jgi:hypothetical protein